MKSIKSALLVLAAFALMAVPFAQSGRAFHHVNVMDITGPGPLPPAVPGGPIADITGPGPLSAALPATA